MAASSGSADTGNEATPTFTFEQVVLRFVVGVMFLALLVMVIEFGQVRGRVHELETGGAPSLVLSDTSDGDEAGLTRHAR